MLKLTLTCVILIFLCKCRCFCQYFNTSDTISTIEESNDTLINKTFTPNESSIKLTTNRQLQIETVPDYMHNQQYKNYSLGKNIRKALTIPAALAIIGCYSGNENNTHGFIGKHTISNKLRESFPYFHTYADDYIQHAPFLSAYALELFGVKGKNATGRKTWLLIQSEIVCIGTAHILKTISANTRPNGKGQNSFPSGHTTQAFVGATFLHKEYGHLSPWYSIGAYTVATSVGCMRMLNNAHWFSDVMVGAAIGIGGTNLVYTFNKHKQFKERNKSLVALPLYFDNKFGAAVCYTF